MASWKELVGYVEGKYLLSRLEPTWFALRWDFGRDGEPLVQEVRVEQITAFDEPWVLCHSRICAEVLLDSKELLTRNAALAVGSIALVKGIYLVRQPLRLSTLCWEELDRVLLFIGREACALMGDLERTAAWPGLLN